MKTTNLAQALAIDSQLRLPGSAGRLLKQIRDIEQVAPLFRDVGLIKAVKRPSVVNLAVSGIASHSCIRRALGGFIYASAAVRTDLNDFRKIRSVLLGLIQYPSWTTSILKRRESVWT